MPYLDAPLLILDFETTGLDPEVNEPIQVGALLVTEDLVEVAAFVSLIRPQAKLGIEDIPKILKIKLNDLLAAPHPAEVFKKLQAFGSQAGQVVVVGYHVEFDLKFLRAAEARHGVSLKRHKAPVIDVMELYRARFGMGKYEKGAKLTDATARYGIPHQAHDALGDVRATLEVLRRIRAEAPHLMPKLPSRPKPKGAFVNYYEVLKVTPDASTRVIEAAYKARMMEEHPDVGGSTEYAQLVNKAREILTDTIARKQHDEELCRRAPRAERCAADTQTLVICLACGAKNRVVPERIHDGKCGVCKAPFTKTASATSPPNDDEAYEVVQDDEGWFPSGWAGGPRTASTGGMGSSAGDFGRSHPSALRGRLVVALVIFAIGFFSWLGSLGKPNTNAPNPSHYNEGALGGNHLNTVYYEPTGPMDNNNGGPIVTETPEPKPVRKTHRRRPTSDNQAAQTSHTEAIHKAEKALGF